MRAIRANSQLGFTGVVGIGGIGAGIVFALDGDHTLGRNESRLGKLLDARDYCKLHIVEHYIAKFMGAGKRGESPFRVAAVGVVGEDEVGKQMVQEMARVGIDVEFVRVDSTRRTLFSVCFVYPDGAGGNITTSNSAAAVISSADVQSAARLLEDNGHTGIALCLPEVPMQVRSDFLRRAASAGSYRAASFASADVVEARDTRLLALVDLLALNKEEASALVGYPYETTTSTRFLQECARLLTELNPKIRILLTVGADGAFAFEAGAWDFCPAPKVQVESTAGAGDALLAGALCAISAGVPFVSFGRPRRNLGDRSLGSALDFGVLLASYTVQSPHTIHPDATLDSLLEFAKQQNVSFSSELAKVFCPSGESVAAGE
jgi:sugar/nucleoside kinase (ribokinase family)